MTATTTPPAPGVLPTYADTILSAVLVGAGSALVRAHLLTTDQLNAGVSAVLVLIGLAWCVINASPTHRSPIAVLLSLVRAAPPAQQAAFDGGLTAAEAALLARLTPAIHAMIHQRAGILAGPVDALADKAARQAADGVVQHLKV